MLIGRRTNQAQTRPSIYFGQWANEEPRGLRIWCTPSSPLSTSISLWNTAKGLIWHSTAFKSNFSLEPTTVACSRGAATYPPRTTQCSLAVAGGYRHGPEEIYAHDAALRRHFNPTISFDSNGIMRIMVSLHRMHPSDPYVFALLGETRGQYIGVLLRRLPGLETVYRRVGYKECMMNNEISPYKVPEWVYIK